jgi:hypothetical protein
MATTIGYEVRRGQTWVALDAEDVRWEVKDEAASSREDSGTAECGGQTYRWSRQVRCPACGRMVAPSATIDQYEADTGGETICRECHAEIMAR